MSHPIPRDLRQLRVTPEQIDSAMAEILGDPTTSLAEEVEQLDRAHNVLRDALQEN